MKESILRITQYGFIWNDCVVERTCNSSKNPKFQVLTVWCPNGEGFEILMRPRSCKVKKFKKEKLTK